MLGGAVHHSRSRAERRLHQLQRFPDNREEHNGDGSVRHSLRINDPYYCRTPEDLAIRHSERAEVYSALQSLPYEQREAVEGLLRGRSQDETARVLGVHRNTVARHLERGLQTLKAYGWDRDLLCA